MTDKPSERGAGFFIMRAARSAVGRAGRFQQPVMRVLVNDVTD
jgi:hypothetical protein